MIQDPMVIFYCLFFCIFYKNEALIEYLRQIIQSLNPPKNKGGESIDTLLEFIDNHGIVTLRTVSEKINTIVYHMVLYLAIDDDFKSVYSNIIRQLKYI